MENGAEIAASIRGGKRKAASVARETLDRIAAGNGRINAFTAIFAERAAAEADAVDAAIAAGRDPGPLAGVPYAVKNLFDVKGIVTLAGSKIDADKPAASRDGTAVRRLREAGAVLVGALNMDEYAYGFTTENTHYGACRNPHDPTRIAGGSSGGSGAAVAAGFVPLSLGTDTNGSIRVPASFCGIFGLKPTYGRLSRAGSTPFVASLDHIGPLARSVADLAFSYDALQGADDEDPGCAGRAIEPVAGLIDRGIGDLRIAIAGDYFRRSATPDALGAVDTAAAALGATRSVTVPEAARARAAAFVITASEGANLHFADLASRPDDFDPMIRDRLLAGALVPAHWLIQAQRFRRWYRDQLMMIFRDTDILLAPATPCTAPRIGQETMVLDGQEMLTRPNIGLFTQPISFIGLPVVAAPIPAPGRLPIAIQIIAAPWAEEKALRVARYLEERGVARAPIATAEAAS